MRHTSPLLIQVVPQLKPGRCGVTDHVIQLASELKCAFGIGSAFVVLNSNERCDLPYPIIYCDQENLLESCLALSEGGPGAVLVHVSGYGYSPDGAPTRLADALSRVRENGSFDIAAFFHEISATGAPWTSAFWHTHRQQRAIRKIAEQCDLMVTNMDAHAQWLERETKRRPGAPIRLLPVLSTIGEARDRTPLAKRTATMTVFGLPGTRQRAFRELSRLAGFLNALRIDNIIDIGAGSDFPDKLHGITVRHRGELDVLEIAEGLSQSTFGYLSYTPSYLAKSSIFAAYCSHGTIPVIATPFAGELDGLRDGVHLLSPKTVDAASASGLERCSIQAWDWYTGHRIHVHAETYAHWLNHPALEHEREEVKR